MPDAMHILLPLGAGGVVTVGALGTLTLLSLAPRCRLFGDVVWGGAPDGPPRVALTFDDGPTADSTARILDALRDAGAPAAFFVVGRNAERHPDLLRRMRDEGHVVANHSYDHSHYGFFRAGRYWDAQIARTDEVIERATGLRPALFRPPMGMKTWSIARAARRRGHSVITWTRRAIDGITTTPPKICARLGPHARAGDVLVLHDGVEPHSRRDPRPTVEAVGPLVRKLRERGLEIVRLDKLVGVNAYLTPAPVVPDSPERAEDPGPQDPA